MIDYSQTGGEEYVGRIEIRGDFVKAYVDVFDRAFEVDQLFVCEVGCRKLVGRLVLGVSQI